MKRAQIHGPGDLRLDDVPEPEIGPRDVIVAVGAAPVLTRIIERAKPHSRVWVVALHRQPIEVHFMIDVA